MNMLKMGRVKTHPRLTVTDRLTDLKEQALASV